MLCYNLAIVQLPESHPNFPEQEMKTLAWWEKEKIPEKYRHRNDNSEKNFRFLDGPITANNPMGVHHAHGRAIKDFFQRYKNMTGHKQRFQNGFDCQGLWVEVEEEKGKGFDSKHDIERYGIDKFCQDCRVRVEKYSQVQTRQSQRLGMFMDWENSYYTMSENNNLHIWHFLKEVDRRGWLYKGMDAMPWCTRCGTAISQHELSDGGYKDVDHESVYVKLKVESGKLKIGEKFGLDAEKEAYLLIWTTTPWTLLANVAVAVHPDLEYVVAEVENEYLILAKSRLEVLGDNFQVKAELSGQELLVFNSQLSTLNSQFYTGPFDELEAPAQVTHRLIPWTEISDQEGTGLVHIAPGAGKEDFELHKQFELDHLAPIDEFGDYVGGYGEFTGMNVTAVRKRIYDWLKERGLFFKTASIHHSYPHCWRCKHELVFRTTTEWFIKADEIRPLMKAAAEKVNWMPTHAGKRMQDWLDNMSDWPISRKRYWGLALPFFESEDGSEYYVVGSKEELRELAVDPKKVDQLPELHRPWVDEIVIKSPKTQKLLKRVPDVGDCWLDAGIVPFSTVDFLADPDYWREWYPFDFITEYVPQVKLWFYATLFMSVTLENQAPWKNVLATGFLVDEKGEHMHKSKGNSIDFDKAAEKAGADAIRWLYLRERSANYHGTGDLRFGYHVLDDVRRRFFVILWNAYRFFVQNAGLDEWKVESGKLKIRKENVLDKWILSRVNSVLKVATESIEKYDSTTAAAEIEKFVVNDFSQWYIRRSRDRVGPAAENSQDKEDFYCTSYHILYVLSQTLAPFTPFLAEDIYQNLRRKNDPVSIHLTDWPAADPELLHPELEENMEQIRAIAEKTHAARKLQAIPVRQPLAGAVVKIDAQPKFKENLRRILLDETNLLNIKFEVEENQPEIQVTLDTTLTKELRDQRLLREFSRAVQELRRQSGCNRDQRVRILVHTKSSPVAQVIQGHISQLKQKLLADKLELSSSNLPDTAETETIDLDGELVEINLQKL